MGLRSRMRSIAICLLESLVGSHSSHREHHLSCRVCAAEQAIRADDQSICASHLLTHLDSLAPGTQTSTASLSSPTTASPSPTVSTTASTSASTAHKTRRKSLARQQTTTMAMAPTPRSTCPCTRTGSDACLMGTCECRHKCGCDCNCIENQTLYLERRRPEYYAKLRRDSFRPVDSDRIVQSLQTALGSLRYAISGQLGVQLQASRTDKGSRFFRAAFINNETMSSAALAVSEASRPAIVCPRSTLDVLPSWAAASRGQYTFGPDQGGDGDHPAPSSLRINVDGTLTKVHVDWVTDEQFNCAPYVVEDLTTRCPSSTVPVLSLSSLIHQAADLLGASTDASSIDQRILTNHVTIDLKIKQQHGLAVPTVKAPALYGYAFVDMFCTNSFRSGLYDHFYNEPPQERAIRRKPVPASSVHKALPPTPPADNYCSFQ